MTNPIILNRALNILVHLNVRQFFYLRLNNRNILASRLPHKIRIIRHTNSRFLLSKLSCKPWVHQSSLYLLNKCFVCLKCNYILNSSRWAIQMISCLYSCNRLQNDMAVDTRTLCTFYHTFKQRFPIEKKIQLNKKICQ